MSRIEQRRLEAAMKASMGDPEKETGKDAKKSKPVETPSSQSAKKAKVAAPRETKGGKRIPTSAGKKRRKADSASDSSQESDDGMNSDSSSEVETSKAVPLKKRTKVAAPQAADSDSSEFEDEFDEEHYKGEEDKKWMLTLNELEREAILSERRDKRELAKEVWMLQHKKKKERPADSTPSSIMTSRTKRQQNKPDEKKSSVKAALEDMQARKLAATKTARLKALQDAEKSDSDDDVKLGKDDDDDDDVPKSRGEEREEQRDRSDKFAKPRHRQVPEEHYADNYPRISVEAMEEVRVSRDKLIEYAKEPFFSEFVQGLFARVNIGVSQSGESRYLLCQIMGVKDKGSEYEVEVAGRTVKVKKSLFVVHAGQKKTVLVTQISNKPFNSKEVDRWAYDMHKQSERMPSEEKLSELREQLRKKWKEAFKYDAEAVEAMVEENLKQRKKTGNVVLNKIQLQEERDQAWEEYKNLDNDEEKNSAYERWEQLREQVLQVEELEKKEQDKAIAQERGVSTINNRNFEANRTVKKKWHLEDNDTCTREYKRTGYYVFGVGDDSKEITREKDFGKELAAREAAALAAGGKKPTVDVTRNYEDDDLPLQSPSGTLQSPKAGTPTAAGAIARAHQTELAVEVDTQVNNQPKKAEEAVVLGPRPVNPLKPTGPAKPVAGGGKVTLSLDDYKRRRGLA